MSEVDDRVAIVTGGTRGIGRAIAEALVAAGLRVAVCGRTARAVGRAAEELDAQVTRDAPRPRAIGVPCDVARHEDCKRLVEETVARFGRLDVLINNAGVGTYANVAELAVEEWDAVIGTNLNGVFYCTREAVPHLRRAGGGWIINIGSLAGKNAFAGGAAYNASKFGLIGFSEAVMQDLRYDGIRVSCIMPGSVATEFGGVTASGQDWKILPEDVARMVTDLLAFPARTLPSRVEVRPSRPPRR
jgi:NAD(P)-dependent dehydrogenase (short-subunit alcohol dehydrogenase family)